MKKADSLPQERETPDGLHEQTLPGIESMPAFPPAVMLLEGNAADDRVLLQLYSYTVAMAVIDMFEKVARKKKRAAELKLWNTGGTWRRDDWVLLKTTSLSSR